MYLSRGFIRLHLTEFVKLLDAGPWLDKPLNDLDLFNTC